MRGVVCCSSRLTSKFPQSNVLVGADGSARLSDFSPFLIRTAIASNSHHNSGTRYSAPELFSTEDQKPTGKSDIYSLSMIIVEVCVFRAHWSSRPDGPSLQLATGQTPFFGSSDSNVIDMVLRGERPQKPRRFNAPGITAEVWNIAEQCWRKRAMDRPKVKNVLQDLEQVASSGEHTHEACPRSLWELIFYSRNRWPTVLVGAKVAHIQMTAVYAGDKRLSLSTRVPLDVYCARVIPREL